MGIGNIPNPEAVTPSFFRPGWLSDGALAGGRDGGILSRWSLKLIHARWNVLPWRKPISFPEKPTL